MDGESGAPASAQGGRSVAALLSLIDGRTSFHELLSVSGMGPFEALRIFARLVDAEIVGVAA